MTAMAARSSPRTSSFSDREGRRAGVARALSGGRQLDTGGVQLGSPVTAAAAQVPRDDLQLHRDGFGKASVSQFGRRNDHNAAACETFNLCVEAMANQIGHRIETLAAHSHGSLRLHCAISTHGKT